jgi:thioesterase domain-containing protein
VSIAPFLSELRRLDIRVWVDGEQLRCNARTGALTDELREQLRQRKSEIVSFLRMADVVSAQPRGLVPLQASGSRAPIFGVPGHTGDVFQYQAFVEALGDERPFFALQPPGLDGCSQPLVSVEELASYFAEQIRAVEPRGPWIIAGLCMGGTVAFELAQRLLAGGSSDGFLALFGAPYPTFFRPLSLFRHHLQDRAVLWRHRVGLLATQSGRERLEYITWRLRPRKQAADPVMLARGRLEATTLRAVRAYKPRLFGGRVHHFLPCEAWPRRARSQAERWRSVVGHLETYAGPEGCTGDDMLLARHAPTFARLFRLSCTREGL